MAPMDGLKPFVLKELPRNKLEELLFIYKTMILLQCTSTQWTMNHSQNKGIKKSPK